MQQVLCGVSFVTTNDTSAAGWGSPAALLEAASIVESLGGVLRTVKHPSRESLYYNILASPGEGTTASDFKEKADLCNRPIWSWQWLLAARSRPYLSFSVGDDVAVPDEFNHPILFGDIARRDAYVQKSVQEVSSGGRGQTATDGAFVVGASALVRNAGRLDGAGHSLASVPALYDTQGSQLAAASGLPQADEVMVEASGALPEQGSSGATGVVQASPHAKAVMLAKTTRAPRTRHYTDAQPQDDEIESEGSQGLGAGVCASSPGSRQGHASSGVSPTSNNLRSPAGQFAWGGQESQVLFFQRSPAPPAGAAEARSLSHQASESVSPAGQQRLRENGQSDAAAGTGAPVDRCPPAHDSADVPGTTLSTANGENSDAGSSTGRRKSTGSPGQRGKGEGSGEEADGHAVSTTGGAAQPEADSAGAGDGTMPDISLGSSKRTPGSKASTSTSTTTTSTTAASAATNSTSAALTALAGLPTSQCQGAVDGSEGVLAGMQGSSTTGDGVYDAAAQDNTSWSGPTPWQPYPPPSAGISAYNPAAYGYAYGTGGAAMPPSSALPPHTVSRVGPLLNGLLQGASAMKTPAMAGLGHLSESSSLPAMSSESERRAGHVEGVGRSSIGTGETTGRKRVRIDAPPGNGDSPAAHRAYQSHVKLQQPCLHGTSGNDVAASVAVDVQGIAQYPQQQPRQQNLQAAMAAESTARAWSSPQPEPILAGSCLKEEQADMGVSDTQDSFWVGFGEGVESQVPEDEDAAGDTRADAGEEGAAVNVPAGSQGEGSGQQQEAGGETGPLSSHIASAPAAQEHSRTTTSTSPEDNAGPAGQSLISPILFAPQPARLHAGAGAASAAAPVRPSNVPAEPVLSAGSAGSEQQASQAPSQPPGLFIASQQPSFGGTAVLLMQPAQPVLSSSAPVPDQRSPAVHSQPVSAPPPRMSQESGNTGGSPPFSREATPSPGHSTGTAVEAMVQDMPVAPQVQAARDETGDADEVLPAAPQEDKGSSAPSTQSAHGASTGVVNAVAMTPQPAASPDEEGVDGPVMQDMASLSESSTVPDGQEGYRVAQELVEGHMGGTSSPGGGVGVERSSSQVQGSSPVEKRAQDTEGCTATAAPATKAAVQQVGRDGGADAVHTESLAEVAAEAVRPAKRYKFQGKGFWPT